LHFPLPAVHPLEQLPLLLAAETGKVPHDQRPCCHRGRLGRFRRRPRNERLPEAALQRDKSDVDGTVGPDEQRVRPGRADDSQILSRFSVVSRLMHEYPPLWNLAPAQITGH
jgi:hypothetical protein